MESELWAACLGFCGEQQLDVIPSGATGLPNQFEYHPFCFIDQKEQAQIRRKATGQHACNATTLASVSTLTLASSAPLRPTTAVLTRIPIVSSNHTMDTTRTISTTDSSIVRHRRPLLKVGTAGSPIWQILKSSALEYVSRSPANATLSWTAMIFRASSLATPLQITTFATLISNLAGSSLATTSPSMRHGTLNHLVHLRHNSSTILVTS